MSRGSDFQGCPCCSSSSSSGCSGEWWLSPMEQYGHSPIPINWSAYGYNTAYPVGATVQMEYIVDGGAPAYGENPTQNGMEFGLTTHGPIGVDYAVIVRWIYPNGCIRELTAMAYYDGQPLD